MTADREFSSLGDSRDYIPSQEKKSYSAKTLPRNRGEKPNPHWTKELTSVIQHLGRKNYVVSLGLAWGTRKKDTGRGRDGEGRQGEGESGP